jgi:cytochrome c
VPQNFSLSLKGSENFDVKEFLEVPFRFVRTVLDFNLNEPMEIDELPGKGILFVERRGALRLYDFAEGKTKTLAQLELFYGNEDGLLGLAIDPNYTENNLL